MEALALLLAASAVLAPFQSARPVWPRGHAAEMNAHAVFRAKIRAPEGPVTVRVAAASVYRLTVNGEFRGYGPARAPHGYARVDEWPVSLRPGENVVEIEAAGYNVNSYYLTDEPAFVQAEITAGGRVLAATGGADPLVRGRPPGRPSLVSEFEAGLPTSYVQRVQRYSFQRPFIEYRRLPEAPFRAVKLETRPQPKLLARGIPLPDFTINPARTLVSTGALEPVPLPAEPWIERSIRETGKALKGFPESEFEVYPSQEWQRWRNAFEQKSGRALDAREPLRLGARSYALVDFGLNRSGFLRLHVSCARKAKLMAVWDEVLTKGDVDLRRSGTTSILGYELEPGEYTLESMDPYTIHFLKLMALEGDVAVSAVEVRDYANPDVWQAEFRSSDERLNRIFAAARETFRQNSVDLFMDCPSRERAPWLGDSFFTSRTAALLSGHTRVERIFFENYALPEKFADIPDGMVPMLYPGDHNDGNFIPTYAFWFILQLDEYARRSGDRALIEAMRPRVMGILRYFEKFRNDDGLLEKLEKWVFIEWSAANKYVQDVNYPANMMYAAALDAAGKLYGDAALRGQAERVRETICRQSYDGEFFVDNALRAGGKLTPTRNRTEVCQYFAFYFGTATPERYPELWRRLRDEFGPERKAYPEIAPSNMIYGKMLRFELLSRAGAGQQILDESVATLLYMADATGTLWENTDLSASTNHGMMSHAAVTLYRDLLGAAEVDARAKRLRVVLPALKLDWCEGRLPTPDGAIEISWRKEAGKLLYRATAPPGWKVEVENRSGVESARAD